MFHLSSFIFHLCIPLLALLQACVGCGGKKTDPDWRNAVSVADVLNTKKPRAEGDRFIFQQPPKKGGHQIVFYNGSRRVELNGTLLWLNTAPIGEPGSRHWRVHREDLNTLAAITLPYPTASNRLVMLDPGHGGNDPGATSADKRLVEKDLALELALRVRSHLEARGISVVMTRETDTTLSLADRSLLAATHKPGLFVSIHLNQAANPNASGVETFILPAPGFPATNSPERPAGYQPTEAEKLALAACPGNAFDPASARLGFALHRRLAHLADADRGVKRARFSVLAKAPCPAVLVECGFLSNPGDAAKFDTPAHKTQTARAIADAISDYLGEGKN